MTAEVKTFNWEKTGVRGVRDVEALHGSYTMALEAINIVNSEVAVTMIKSLILVGGGAIGITRLRDGFMYWSSIPSFDILRDNLNEAGFIILMFKTQKMLEQFEAELIDEMKKKVKKPALTVKNISVKELPVDD